jgi:hypothetical protein
MNGELKASSISILTFDGVMGHKLGMILRSDGVQRSVSKSAILNLLHQFSLAQRYCFTLPQSSPSIAAMCVHFLHFNKIVFVTLVKESVIEERKNYIGYNGVLIVIDYRNKWSI